MQQIICLGWIVLLQQSIGILKEKRYGCWQIVVILVPCWMKLKQSATAENLWSLLPPLPVAIFQQATGPLLKLWLIAWADWHQRPNHDGKITLNEMKAELFDAMKYREKQLSGTAFYNVSESTTFNMLPVKTATAPVNPEYIYIQQNRFNQPGYWVITVIT